MSKPVKTKKVMARLEAIELLANNVTMDNKTIAEKVGISAPTLRQWLTDPVFSDALYKRYMEVAGVKIPKVIDAMISEAEHGNVQAGKLILEHFGKLIPSMQIQVESNFEKFLNAHDAEFSEIDKPNVIDLLSQRQEIEFDDKDRVTQVYEQYETNNKKSVKEKQNERYLIRKRAEKVGLELLPPGRHTRSTRNKWMKQLEKLENEEKNEN